MKILGIEKNEQGSVEFYTINSEELENIDINAMRTTTPEENIEYYDYLKSFLSEQGYIEENKKLSNEELNLKMITDLNKKITKEEKELLVKQLKLQVYIDIKNSLGVDNEI